MDFTLKRGLNISLLALLLLSMFIVNTSGEGMLRSTNGSIMSFMVHDAYYADMDSDGIKDDIHSLIDIHIQGKATRYNFILYITLTLPSGAEYTYGYSIKTKILDFTAKIIFINHATEQGWYTIRLIAVLYSGRTAGNAIDECSFDPPGGNPGGDPHAIFSLL